MKVLASLVLIGLVTVHAKPGDIKCGAEFKRAGGCPQYFNAVNGVGPLGLGKHDNTDKAECEKLCQENSECAGFVMMKSQETCYLVKAGCTQGHPQSFDVFETYDFHRCSCATNNPCKNGAQCKDVATNKVECCCRQNFYYGQDCSLEKNCKRENGYCVRSNGWDQNSGVFKQNSDNGNTQAAQDECLKLCRERPDATGCEVIWSQGNRGCYIHTQEIARGNGHSRHYCWVFSKCSKPLEPTDICNKEQGYCVRSNGRDQNSGVIKLNGQNGDSASMQAECEKECRNYPGATGCEVIWDQGNRGCYVHTRDIDRGNGAGRHLCWVFRKCNSNNSSYCK